jgi:hypothetical protein
MKRFWSFLCWIIGEGIIIAAILYFGKDTNQSILMLNGIVSSIILSVLILNVFFPMLGHSERSSKKAEKLGTRWFFTITYAILSIGAILYFELVNPVDLLTQVMIQLIFLSVLFMGLWAVFRPAKKNSESDKKIQIMERNQLIMINNVIGIACSKAERRADIPASVLNGIKDLQNDARVLSPGNETVALRMEGKIMVEINQLNRSLKEERIDLRSVQYTIKNCSKIFNEHRRIYSH